MKDINKYYTICKNKLYPINRSLTVDGVIKTLKLIKKEFKDLKIKKIKSGTKVFDWKVPPEWNLKYAFIKDKNGKRIVDFRKNNLHYDKMNFRKLSFKMENPSDWRGNLIASSFIIDAKKI